MELSKDDSDNKKILTYFNQQYGKEPRHAPTVEEISKATGLSEARASGLIERMYQQDWLENPYRERDMYRITDLGIKQLETIYDPEYMKEVVNRHFEERKKEEQKIQRETKNLNLNTVGTIAGIIIGSVALIIAILK